MARLNNPGMETHIRRTAVTALMVLASLTTPACATPGARPEPPADAPPAEPGEAQAKAPARPTPPELPGDAELAETLIAAHNRVRERAKLPPLTPSDPLTAAARVQALDMAEHAKMAHEGSDGSNPQQRMTRQGFKGRGSAENVAYGAQAVPEVIDLWLNSPPHKKNMLGDYDQIGVARRDSEDGTPYWCVDFGKSWPLLDPEAAAKALIEEVNRVRADAKVEPLTSHKKLAEIAGKMAQEMADQAKEGKPTQAGDDLGARLKAVRYRFQGVQMAIAVYSATPEEVVKTWLDNEGVKSGLLGEYTEAGVGVARGDDGAPYWCLILAEPSD